MTPEQLSTLVNLGGSLALALAVAVAAFSASRRYPSGAARFALLVGATVVGIVAMVSALAEVASLTFWNVPVTVTLGGYLEYRPGRFVTLPHLHTEWGTMNPAWKRVAIDTNSDGLRTTVEPNVPKASGERRVLLLGDSFVFGLGLDADETVDTMLERRLDERDGSTWRVVNAGVPGYNLFSDIDLFDWIVDHYHPDVTVLLVQHDDMLPDLNDQLRLVRVHKTSGLARFALYRFARAGGSFMRYRALLTEDLSGAVTSDVPKPRDGGEAGDTVTRLRQAAVRLDEIAQRSGTSVAIAFLASDNDHHYRALVKNMGYGPLADAHVRFGSVEWDTQSNTDRIPGDGHPTPAGAQKIAAAIAPLVRRAAHGPREK